MARETNDQMWIVEKVINYLLLIIGLLAAIMALKPEEWKPNILKWLSLLSASNVDWITVLLVCILLTAVLYYYRKKKEVTVWKQRKEWWNKKIPKIVAGSEKLVVVDSYQGSKHEFWTSLEKRINEDRPFHFVMLDLGKDDEMLEHCMETSGVTEEVSDIDRSAILRLISKRDESRKGDNKTIEFGYWRGIIQGPLVAWTIKGKEIIAAGLWQQVEGSTDFSPWIVSETGPLYDSLKANYESLIRDARKNSRICSDATSIKNFKDI